MRKCSNVIVCFGCLEQGVVWKGGKEMLKCNNVKKKKCKNVKM